MVTATCFEPTVFAKSRSASRNRLRRHSFYSGGKLETNFEKGQALVEMVIVTSAIILFLLMTVPRFFAQMDRETNNVSVTREILK
jgi:hypothetical protein